LDRWVESKGVQRTSTNWTDWAEPIAPLSAQWHFRPNVGPLTDDFLNKKSLSFSKMISEMILKWF
jgi:hypothetical protein